VEHWKKHDLDENEEFHRKTLSIFTVLRKQVEILIEMPKKSRLFELQTDTKSRHQQYRSGYLHSDSYIHIATLVRVSARWRMGG
jgi:hypothetical protein